MTVRTTARLADPYGNHLIEIANYEKLDYVLNCAPGAIGVLEMTLPTGFDTSLLRRDGRIGAWRSIDGRPAYLDNNAIFLISTLASSSAGTFVRAYHATQLMARRIVAYYAGSSYTDKTGTADNLIKAYWDENAGSSSEVLIRDGPILFTDWSALVSRQADLSLGISVDKAAARRNLLEVAKELAEASTAAGTYLTFEIMAPTESTLELRTYTTARGVDRRASTANPVILSEARGNLEQATLTVDWHDMATMIVVGGSGEKVNRLVLASPELTEAPTILIGSPFARIERFLDMSNVDSLSALDDEGHAELRNARARTILTGTLIETPSAVRGIHFDLGDIITAEHPRTRQQFDMRIDVIHETISSGGRSMTADLVDAPVQIAAVPAASAAAGAPHKTRVGLRSVD